MIPEFVTPTQTERSAEDFGSECKRRFLLHCRARDMAPFHKDKRKYADAAWAEVDAYLDWLEIEAL